MCASGLALQGFTVWPASPVAAFRQAFDMTSKLRRDCEPDTKAEPLYNGLQAPFGSASRSSAAPKHACVPRASAILGEICGLIA